MTAARQRWLDVRDPLGPELRGALDDRAFRLLERLVEPPDDDERQDHLVVVGLLEVAAQ
jgi:hypothetical protein